MNPAWELRNVGMRYGAKPALENVDLTFASSEFAAIAGPNGAGKSTLLSVMAGLRSGFTGECLFGGRPVGKWSRREFARRVSVVPQSVRIEFPFTAEQVVLMGRTPFADAMFESDEDAIHVEQAMGLTGVTAFRHRPFQSLSGGEKQRVILASALAQTPETLLLDEPTTFLDLEHQVSLYKLLRSLASDGLLVVTITHDLNLASAFASRVVLLSQGRVVADGSPSDVLQPAAIRDVFQVDAQVEMRQSGRPWIYYGG